MEQEGDDGNSEGEPGGHRTEGALVSSPRYLRVHLAHAHKFRDHYRALERAEEPFQTPRQGHVPDLLQRGLHVVAPDRHEHERDAHPRRHGGETIQTPSSPWNRREKKAGARLADATVMCASLVNEGCARECRFFSPHGQCPTAHRRLARRGRPARRPARASTEARATSI
jgi:hypothetical protein